MNDGPDRLPPVVWAAHRAAEEAGADGYIDPVTGFWVFTASYLRDRGHCCGSGCRHCPYDSKSSVISDDGARPPDGR